MIELRITNLQLRCGAECLMPGRYDIKMKEYQDDIEKKVEILL